MTGDAITLPNFVENIHSLLHHKKLFQNYFKDEKSYTLPLSFDKYEQPQI